MTAMVLAGEDGMEDGSGINTAIVNVNRTVIHNTYIDRSVIHNSNNNRRTSV